MWGFLAFAPEMSQLCTADELGNWTEELGVFFYPKTYAIWKVSCWETCLHIFWYSKEPSWEVNINPLQGIFASMWIFLFPYVTSLEGTPFPFGRLSILRFPLVASLCGATNWSNLRSSQVWNESMKGETQNHVEKSHFNLGSCHGVDWFYIFSKGRLGDFCLRFFWGFGSIFVQEVSPDLIRFNPDKTRKPSYPYKGYNWTILNLILWFENTQFNNNTSCLVKKPMDEWFFYNKQGDWEYKKSPTSGRWFFLKNS